MMLESLERVGVLSLQPELAVPRAGGIHHSGHAGEDLGWEMFHQFGIFVDERFAFRSVGDEELYLRLRFDIGGKAGAAGADHTTLTQFLAEHRISEYRRLSAIARLATHAS